MQKPAAAKPVATKAIDATPPKPAPAPLVAGQVANIAAGQLVLGSAPGSVNRDPSREADLVTVELGEFSIDRLPYPNDPALPPLANVTRDEAATKCSEAGKRLCTEFEWERACKGDEGVSELGTKVREWTASNASGGMGASVRTAVTRGSTSDAPASEHRCPARNAATPDSRSESIGFRCCQGDATEITYPTEAKRPLIAPLELSQEALRRQLSSVPELAQYAETFEPLSRGNISRALARGGRGADNVTLWTIAPAVFTWSPMQGEEIVVISGTVGDSVLLAALYPHDGKWIHGASTLLADKDSSVAIGAREDDPTSLLWTSCWGCYGEGGRLSIAADQRVSVQFR